MSKTPMKKTLEKSRNPLKVPLAASYSKTVTNSYRNVRLSGELRKQLKDLSPKCLKP